MTNPEHALQGLATALNRANGKGCYSLAQSAWIMQALETVAEAIGAGGKPCEACGGEGEGEDSGSELE